MHKTEILAALTFAILGPALSGLIVWACGTLSVNIFDFSIVPWIWHGIGFEDGFVHFLKKAFYSSQAIGFLIGGFYFGKELNKSQESVKWAVIKISGITLIQTLLIGYASSVMLAIFLSAILSAIIISKMVQSIYKVGA